MMYIFVSIQKALYIKVRKVQDVSNPCAYDRRSEYIFAVATHDLHTFAEYQIEFYDTDLKCHTFTLQ